MKNIETEQNENIIRDEEFLTNNIKNLEKQKSEDKEYIQYLKDKKIKEDNEATLALINKKENDEKHKQLAQKGLHKTINDLKFNKTNTDQNIEKIKRYIPLIKSGELSETLIEFISILENELNAKHNKLQEDIYILLNDIVSNTTADHLLLEKLNREKQEVAQKVKFIDFKQWEMKDGKFFTITLLVLIIVVISVYQNLDTEFIGNLFKNLIEVSVAFI